MSRSDDGVRPRPPEREVRVPARRALERGDEPLTGPDADPVDVAHVLVAVERRLEEARPADGERAGAGVVVRLVAVAAPEARPRQPRRRVLTSSSPLPVRASRPGLPRSTAEPIEERGDLARVERA